MLPDAGRLRQEEQHWLAKLLAAILRSCNLGKDELAACHCSVLENAAKKEELYDRSTVCMVKQLRISVPQAQLPGPPSERVA